MKFTVSVEQYSGPMDLLLSLIDKNKVDIFDIPIAQITREYLEIVQEFEKNGEPEEIADFLIMATTLMQIKTKTMLMEPDEEIEEDPREELTKRLMEYKKFKEASQMLEKRMSEAFQYHDKHQEDLSQYEENNGPQIIPETIDELYQAFLKLIDIPVDIESKIIDEEDYPIGYFLEFLRKEISKKTIVFKDLFLNKSKPEMIVMFLAILELLKNGEIVCVEKSLEIFLEMRKTDE